jgi:hypothetical protein
MASWSTTRHTLDRREASMRHDLFEFDERAGQPAPARLAPVLDLLRAATPAELETAERLIRALLGK